MKEQNPMKGANEDLIRERCRMGGAEKVVSSCGHSHDNWPLISVVVLSYNGKVQIQNCFPAVLNMHYPHYEVIFIDNGSHDGSMELARQLAENLIH